MVEAIVEFDYVAKEPDELSIKIGDVIKDVTKTQPGWCEGVLNEKRGFFPDNFVKLVIEDEVTMRNRTESQRIRKCRVIFSYAKDHEDELSLHIGDVIDIIGEEEEGWWRGLLNGKKGVFPSNFVEEIKSGDEEKTPVLPPKPAKVLCEVKYAYRAQNEDELSLKEGDIITLISKDGQDQGWWRGELNGKTGVFPDNFVIIIDDKKQNAPQETLPITKTASQRKSMENKAPETENRLTPVITAKKPAIPIKKSPSGSSTGGIFYGLKKKIVDAVDGASSSKTKTPEPRNEETTAQLQENAFDQVERNSMLMDVRATRAKPPGRRPPSTILTTKDGEQAVVLNGNSDYGSLEENLSGGVIGGSSTGVESDVSAEAKPKVREWEKHKAPWLEEMKLNQAKRTSTSPGPETRNRLSTTPDRINPDEELDKDTCPSPVDMSRSMPSMFTVAKPLKTQPNEEKVALRNKPNLPVSPRPQTIDSPVKPVPTAKKTLSPIQKPTPVEKTSQDSNLTLKQYNHLIERINKLEEENLANKTAIDDLRRKLQVEADMRMMLQAELEKFTS